MPNFSSIIKGAIEHLRTPAVPELAARGTAAAPTLLTKALAKPLTRERAPSVPFQGAPEVKAATRTTEDKTVTSEERIQNLKTHLGGLIRRDPNVSKDVQEKLYKGAWRKNAAHEVADLDIAQWFSPLKSNPAIQATLVHDYMVTADEVAQAGRYGKDKIRDIALPIWQQSLDRLQAAVDSDPEVVSALKNIRTGLDAQFEDMAARNWIDRNRYLEDYTPIRRINSTLDGLATFYGEDAEALKTRLLSQQQQRVGGKAPRETDMLKVLRATRAEYLRKVAEHEAFVDLASDPTINFTDKVTPGSPIPKGLALFRPGPGGFGSTIKSSEGYFVDGALAALDPKKQMALGGWVFPKPIIDAMNHFNTPVHTGSENRWYKAGHNISKMLTVYNPANTNVNRVSDLAVAMFTPGTESAHPLGVLKWYGKATTAAYKGATGKGGTFVKLHGRTVDVWDMSIREGLTSGTIAHEVSGERLSPELLRLHPEAEQNHINWLETVKRNLQTDRLATEASPRIAAGLEAVERTGDWAQFGKVGRDVTFRYGAGAPRVSQFPAIRMISPFLQFQGLATARILDMANAQSMGTKARLALALAAVPTSFLMWNTQNDEYKQAENALPDYERNQLHIIVPDIINPAKIRRDVEGQPVVLRFRYWVPEQVMSLIGLGNLPEKVARVAQGRDTPMQFIQSPAKEIGRSISSMLTLPSLINQYATGQAQSGMPMEGMDWLERGAPAARIATKGIERGMNYGPLEGIKTAAYEAAGLRFATPRHVDAQLLDAQLQESIRQMREAKGKLVSSGRNKSGTEFKEALKSYKSHVTEVQRLMAQIKKEKAAGYSPPKADRSLTQQRREGVQKVMKEGQ